MKFSEFELHPSLVGAIEKLNFQEPTPVQSAVMPHLLEGRDVAGLAQTGTGKTAAFLLPLMERILRAGGAIEELTPEQQERYQKRAFPDWKQGQFILVLVPTRELAEQVYENAMSLKGDSPLRAVSIYGGVSYDKQKSGLKNGVEFVIATPGRLIDLYKENLVDLKQVRAIVFDEADRMFDMGFKDDMKFILQRVPKERQFLVFSATLNLDVMSTAYQFGANPIDVDVSRDQAKAENVEDSIFHVGQEDKAMYLLTLVKKYKPRQAIIFSNFKMNVPRVAQFLNENGMSAAGISSLLTQAQRTRVMEQFKSEGDRNILVATDVAARGLDIKGVDLIINYELPDDPENYVHRIGRTGRAGAKGMAFSLVSDRDVEALQRIEDYLRHKVQIGWLEETDMVKEFKGMTHERESRGARFDRGGEGRGGGGPRDSRGGGGRSQGRSGGGGSGRGGRDEQRPRPSGGGASGGGPGRGSEREPDRQHRDRSMGRHVRPGGGREEQGPSKGPIAPRAAGESRPTQGGPTARRDFRGRPEPRDQRNKDQRSNGRPNPGRRDSSVHDAKGPRRDHQRSKGPIPKQQPPVSLGKKVTNFFKKFFG